MGKGKDKDEDGQRTAKLMGPRLGSYGGEDSPGDISRVCNRIRPARSSSLAMGRPVCPPAPLPPPGAPFFRLTAGVGSHWLSLTPQGMFAGEVGAPRLLKLFAKYGIKTTWFIPGHSLDTFPEQMAAVRDAGHEM